MDHKVLKNTLLVALVLLIVGILFINRNWWFGYTDSAILYLTVVIGAGFYWLGTILKNK